MTQALEGIENMVLLLFFSLIVATVIILYIGFKYLIAPLTRHVRRGIHPDYQQVIDFTRMQLPRGPDGDGRDRRRDGPAPNDSCPVCMDRVSYAVETNCGHTFCALCITTYWHTGRWTGPVSCPMCRATVNILLPRFSPEEQAEARHSPEGDQLPLGRQMLAEIATYNRRHSGAPVPWLEQLRDLPVLLPYIVSRLFSLDGLNLMYRARIFLVLLFAVVYMLTPVDIIPEAVFGILGILDDVAIFLMVAVYAVMVYRQYAAQQEV